MISSRKHIFDLLDALNASLVALDTQPFELLICGGAALTALEIITRPTLDIDILAIVEEGNEIMAKPLPDELLDAIEKVAAARSLDRTWMNAGPADIQQFGLPPGMLERSHFQRIGSKLSVRFIDRRDQVYLRLYALVDQGKGKHFDDFQKLKASNQEALSAARWCMTQDPSDGFRSVLIEALNVIGFSDVAREL